MLKWTLINNPEFDPMSFVGLHTHSDYSLLDGASQLPDLVARAVELGMPAVAITDHGVMYGAIELLKICRSRQIKPIIGNEMYVMNADVRQQQPRGKAKKYHQIVLAKNTQGYRNLVKLTTVSHLEGFQGKGLFARPCINKELLAQYAEGLIVTSACLGGEIPQNIMKGNLEEARAVAIWYKGVFGDDFYLEIQDHGSVEDRVVNVEIVRIATELGIKIIATNDSHFTSCYDVEAHDALLCIQTGKLIFEDNRMRYSGTEYLKSAEEMAQLFRDHLPEKIIREAIANTLEIADKVEPYTNILGEPRIPDFPLPAGHTPATYVDELSQLGMKERFKVASMQDLPLEYRERLKYELEMIDRMGFSTYFLVVWDYIKFARDKNIPVGPGRGSAAGSLVAYALRITNIDPVHHGLLFERFLNPERKSMPDIDTDFCIERRGEVIEYVTEKYGTDRVAQIITFNRMTSKAVLKDTARVLNIPYAESDRMAKMIPVVRGKPTKLKVMISDDTPAPEFKETYETKTYEDPQTGTKISAKQWLDMAMRIEGTNKTFGVHAAGVVISADPLDEIVPLQRNNDGSVITQYFMEDLDSLGLLKMDFLGLKNLTIIDQTLKLIEKNPHRPHTSQIDPDEITAEERIAHKILKRGNTKKMPNTVSQTYRTIMNGDLEGVFQLESSGMLDVVSKLKPSCIEDISSILALYRPGPLDAGLIPKFIDRKHGREKIEYEHPDLQPILEETYGVLVYQEQIMKIAQELGGYSLGQADLLRRAMGKKKPEEMRKQKETFLDGASRKGIDPAIASALFEQMEKFAEYCFNKSHSTAYGYVTYQTAFLKANYSVEYMAALLTANSDDRDKVTKYLNNCEQTLNIRVQAPDVNRSELTFKPVDNQTILFGLTAIRGVGSGAIESIIAAREEGGKFTSLADFVSRVNIQAVNSKALDALIRCGAFDEIENNRRQLINDMELVIKWAQNRAKEKASGQVSLFDLMPVATAIVAKEDTFVAAPKSPLVADFNSSERLEFEQELLGVYVSDHPLRGIEKAAKRFNIESIKLSAAPEHKNKQITAAALLTEVKVVQTKKDAKSMAILKLTGIDGYQLSGVIFPSDYENNREKLVQNIPALVTGKISRRSQDDEELQIIVSEIRTFDADELAATTTPTPPERHILLNLPLDFIRDPERWKNLRSSLMEYNTDNSTTAIPTKAIIESADTFYHIQFHSRYQIEDPETAIESLHSQGIAAEIRTSTSVLQEEMNDSPQPY